jgi:hypothetical protein
LIEITTRIRSGLDALARDGDDTLRRLEPSRHPQAVMMFAKHAAHQTFILSRSADVASDFDQALNHIALARCLTDRIAGDAPQSPEEPRQPDSAVHRLWHLQFMEELNRHQAACLQYGLRTVWYDPAADRGELRLTKRRRRSALQLLDASAQLQQLHRATAGDLMGRPIDDDAVLLGLASSVEHLDVLRRADPSGWEAFCSAAGFTLDSLTVLSAFVVFLEFAASNVGHSLRYDRSQLTRLYEIFRAGYTTVTLPTQPLLDLVEAFSLTPAESARYLLPVPFFNYGDHYIRAEGFGHILSPAMGLLTIAIRKHEDAWNRTLGSTLAKAADVIAADLAPHRNVLVRARRRIKPHGDIDLALYDRSSRHMLMCEVKTVYDKHRTAIHLHRFEDQKVRLSHAIDQLRTAKQAVMDGTVDLKGVFGEPLPAPEKVDLALLTWIDPIDLTVGTADQDILSLNFATFKYLFRSSGSDLGALVRAVRELRELWCVAQRRPIDLGVPFPVTLEVQIGAIDAKRDLAFLELSELTRRLIDELPHLEDGWQEEPAAETLVSYLTG